MTPDSPAASDPLDRAAPGDRTEPHASPAVLVVVATYNEAANVAPLVAGVLEALPAGELLFVDDSSPDGTSAEVRRLGRADPRVHLLERPRKAGYGTALLEGFEFALARDYRVVVTMDGDLSHDPGALPELVAATAEYDVVVGSRYVDGGGVVNWAFYRRWISRGANAVVRRLLSLRIHDCTSGFRAYRSSVLEALPLGSIRSPGYSFPEEISLLVERHGCRVVEVPIVFVDRTRGRSKVSPRELWRVAVHLLRLVLKRGGRSARAAPAEREGVRPQRSDPRP